MNKKLIVSALVLSIFLAGPVFAGRHETDDFQAIQKAVKQNPSYEPGKEVKWFKVLVVDTRTNKERIRVTLPIALIEAMVKCCGEKDFRMGDSDCDIDFRTLLQEIKKAGPMALIEVMEDDELIKVWLE